METWLDPAREGCLDFAATLLDWWHIGVAWLSFVFTVHFDPFGLARNVIPIREKCAFDGFTVDHAGSCSRDRRLVAWFYRQPNPDADGWNACMERIGGGRGVPPHELRIWNGGFPSGRVLVVSYIRPDAGTYCIRFSDERSFIAGPVPLGGYRPATMINRLVRRRTDDGSIVIMPPE